MERKIEMSRGGTKRERETVEIKKGRLKGKREIKGGGEEWER